MLRNVLAMLILSWTILPLGSAAFAQSDSGIATTDPKWNLQFDLFQYLFEQQGLQVHSNLNTAIRSPNETVVVLMGSVKTIPVSTWRNLLEYVANGGSLVVASDQFENIYGMGSIRPGPVSTLWLDDQFESFSDCLRIRNIADEEAITKDVREIVTNRTGWIEQKKNGFGMNEPESLQWAPLVTLPNNCSPAVSRNRPIIAIGTHPVADAGTAILIADPSIFSNNMIWQADNSRLAIQIAERLSKGRKHLMFQVDGTVMKSVANKIAALMPPPQTRNQPQRPQTSPNGTQPRNDTSDAWDEDVPLPEMDTLLKLANAALHEASSSSLMNDALRNQPRSFRIADYQRAIWRTLAIVLTLLLVWKLLQRSKYIAPFITPRRMWTSHAMQMSTVQSGSINRYAAELMAKDFCREWTGRDSVSDWGFYLDRMRSMKKLPIKPADRQLLELIFHNAIHGVSSTMSDFQLEERALKMKDLLKRYSDRQATSLSIGFSDA